MFKNEAAAPAAVIDYRNIDINKTTADVVITQLPDYYQNCDPNPAEVEYLIEHPVLNVQHNDVKSED